MRGRAVLAAAATALGVASWSGAWSQETRPDAEPDVWKQHAAPDEDVGKGARVVLPFTRDQIRALARLLEQTRRATAEGAGRAVRGRLRRLRIDADTIPEVRVRRGYTTVVGFTDLTGAPWPIEEVLVDRRFLAGEETAPNGHLLYLSPREPFLEGNLAVKLVGLADPVVAMLGGDGEVADFRVDLRLGIAGPNVDASALAKPEAFRAGDEVLAGVLAGSVPGRGGAARGGRRRRRRPRMAARRRRGAGDPGSCAVAGAVGGGTWGRGPLGLPASRHAPAAGERPGPGEAPRAARRGRPGDGGFRGRSAARRGERWAGAVRKPVDDRAPAEPAVPRKVMGRVMVRAVLAGMVVALLSASLHAQSRIETDNRNLKVDPAERVDRQYGESLRERSRQKKDEAERTGKSHIDTLHGPFAPERPEAEGAPPAVGDETERPLPASVRAGEEKPQPKPARRSERGPRDRGYERLDEVDGGELPELIAELLKLWNRPPETVRLQRRERRDERREAAPAASVQPVAANGGPGFPEVAAGARALRPGALRGELGSCRAGSA